MKYLAGILVFLGVGAIVFIVVFGWQLMQTVPSKEAVLDFVRDQKDSLAPGEGIIPDSVLPITGDTEAPVDTPKTEPIPEAVTTNTATQDWLTPSQRTMLKTLGIDESELPTTLTPELEACFVDAIGSQRVEAIKAGDTPSLFEGMKAVACL